MGIPSLAAFNCGQPTIPVVSRAKPTSKSLKQQKPDKMNEKRAANKDPTNVLLEKKLPVQPAEIKSSPKAAKKPVMKNVKIAEAVPEVNPPTPKMTKKIAGKTVVAKKSEPAAILPIVPEVKESPKIKAKNPKEEPKVEKIDALVSNAKVKTPVATPKPPPKKKLALDYTCEGFYNDWIHNLEAPEVKPAAPVPEPKQLSPQVAKKKKKLVLDYTCEGFFHDWMHNLDVVAPPPTVAKPAITADVDAEDMFDDAKDSRRRDFAKVARIKDKKRDQAARRSIGKRIK